MAASDVQREWRFLTGTVDFQELRRRMPPLVTVDGFPPKPGEGYGPYMDRWAKSVGIPTH